jgi:hypothetical protein
LLQPLIQWCEVLHHCLPVELTTGGLLEDIAPGAARAGSHEFLQEVADLTVTVVVGIVRILVQDLAGDMIV